MEYIKEALLNPLLIMENIMGVGFPNEAYPYLNTIYFTFIRLISEVLPLKKYENVLNHILDHAGVTDELLVKLDKNHFKLDGFMAIVDLIRPDLLYIYAKIGSMVKDGSDAEEFALEYRKLINCLSLNPEAIYPDLRGEMMFFSDKSLMDLSVWLTESVMTIVHNALNHNNVKKVGRIYMYQPEHSNTKSTEFHVDEYGRTYMTIMERSKLRMNTKGRDVRKFNRTDLPRQVNKLDKDGGCDLKHPEPVVDTPHKFETKVNRYKFALAKYLFKINKIKMKKHLDKDTIFGMEVQNIDINKQFKKKSPWFDKSEVDIDDEKFTFRFISYVFAWVIRHLVDIAEICYAMNKDSEFAEFESKMDYVKYTVKRSIALAERLMNGESVEDDLLYFEGLMMCMESSPKTKKKVLKNVNNLSENAEILAMEMKPFPHISTYPQEVLMDTLVKLGYMVTTHDKKMKSGISLHNGYRFRNSSETKLILEELGKAIHRSHKNTPTPPMFIYFVCSNPVVMSQFDDVNKNQNLATGVMALKYLAFIINDPYVKERVDNII